MNNTITMTETTAITTEPRRRPFLPVEVGTNENGKPIAVHLEGYIGQPPYYREAADGRKAFLSVSMSMGRTDMAVMAMAEGTFDRDMEYGGSEFCRVNVFGQKADALAKALKKGHRIAVSGELSWETFTRKDGTKGRNLTVNANGVVLLGNRMVAGVPEKTFVHSTRIYTDRDGIEHRQEYASLLCGTVRDNWGMKTAANGKVYTRMVLTIPQPAEKVFDLCNGIESKGKKYNRAETGIRMTMFDRRAEVLTSLLQPGAEVLVSGSVSRDEYNGTVEYSIHPRVVSIMKAVQESSHGGASAGPESSAASTANIANFLDMEGDDDVLPF